MQSVYQEYFEYLQDNVITPFYEKRLNSLKSLRLKTVLRRKNPYLFKAKNIEIASDLVKSIIDAHLSSQEETIFGNLLEGFAIYVSRRLYGGFKSSFRSVDLEFQRNGFYYIVGIKSGTNWGNADQISAMKNHFRIAKEALRIQGLTQEIVAINGCMYGKDNHSFKDKIKRRDGSVVFEDPDRVYYKYAGQDFWQFISEDDQLYQQIIVPIDQKAKEKDDVFKTAYVSKIHEMTEEFMQDFMTQHQIDWVKLIDYVSKRS